jgi:hypothetical protein
LKWIQEGALDDPYGEFFVSAASNGATSASEAISGAALLYSPTSVLKPYPLLKTLFFTNPIHCAALLLTASSRTPVLGFLR